LKAQGGGDVFFWKCIRHSTFYSVWICIIVKFSTKCH
jgi:hypothetical protein